MAESSHDVWAAAQRYADSGWAPWATPGVCGVRLHEGEEIRMLPGEQIVNTESGEVVYVHPEPSDLPVQQDGDGPIVPTYSVWRVDTFWCHVCQAEYQTHARDEAELEDIAERHWRDHARRRQEQEAMSDKDERPAIKVGPDPEPTPPEPTHDSGWTSAGGTTRVVYRGPHGAFHDGRTRMVVNGEPVEVDRERLQHLRFVFPDHTFEEMP